MGARRGMRKGTAAGGRTRRSLCLPVAMSVLVALAASLSAQEPAPPPVVRSVRVRGAYLVSPGTVSAYLRLREGDALDEPGLRARVEQANAAGFFGELSVEVVRLDERSVEVRVQLDELIEVADIRFKGNVRISDARLLSATDLAVGETVDPASARAAQARLSELYARAGYPLASVQAYARFTAEGRAILVFDIVEGPMAWVERVRFEGNAAFSDQTLRSVMKTRERGWPAFARPGRFDEKTFQDDLQRLEQFYYDAGYLDVAVAGYWTYSRDLRRITVRVITYEGPLYVVARIEFTGNTIFRDDELRAAIPLAEGEPLSPPKLEEAKRIIAELYGRQGYVDVGAPGRDTLRARMVFSEKEPSVEVRFRITEGEPVFIRRIRVEGLTKTSELVVLRNLTFYPGERVNADELKKSEQVLRNTGYFDLTDARPVEIFIEPGEEALRDAVVRVKEGVTGTVMFGLGISSETGVLGQISLRERNFDISRWPTSWRDLWEGNALRGGGQQLVAELNLGSERSSFVLSFVDPAVQNSPYSAGAKLYSTLTSWDQFDLARTGFGSSFGRRVGLHNSWRFDVGFERITMTNLAGGAPLQIARDRGSYNKPYVSFTYTVDRRDNPRLPARGYLASATAEVGFLDVDTVKVVADIEKYWTVREDEEGAGKRIVSIRGRAGMMDSYGGGRVPVFERFYAGGAGSLRGFEPWGVAPIEPVRGKQVGGRSMLLGSAEYSFPVIREDLRLATFLDAGYVKDGPFDVLSGWDEVRVSTGVGLRWLIPALGGVPLSVDLAFPILKQPGDRTRAVHFSMGVSHWF